MPVGAYGGRRDIMQLVAPSGPVYQAGAVFVVHAVRFSAMTLTVISTSLSIIHPSISH